jgi:hypothetical protein
VPLELSRSNGAARLASSTPPVVLETDGVRIELPAELTLETVAEIRRLMETADALSARCSQLERALDSRVVIEQAKGVLVERLRIDPETAFRLLRQGARSNRMRLHDLAAAVVSSPVTPPALGGAARNGDAA